MRIPMYVIKDKGNRNNVFVFQNENGTQSEAKYLFKDAADAMLNLLNGNSKDRYYVTLEQ